MTKRKKIFLALLAIPILLIVIIVIENLAYEIIQRQPIPPYQKPELSNPLSVCEKIKDDSLKEICIGKVKNPDLIIDWTALRSAYGADGGAFYHGGGIQEYSEKPKKIENMSVYCEGKEKGKYNILPLIYCKAALVNPYWCNKMQLTPIGKILFNDSGTGPEECFHDIASLWEDPSLCKRAKDKDFCYFRTAVKLIELALKTQ